MICTDVFVKIPSWWCAAIFANRKKCQKIRPRFELSGGKGAPYQNCDFGNLKLILSRVQIRKKIRNPPVHKHMTRKKRRCSLFVYKICGIFGGSPLPPTRKSSKLLNFRRSNLNLAVVRSSIPLPVRPELIPKVLAWGASPPHKWADPGVKSFEVVPDRESSTYNKCGQNLMVQIFTNRLFIPKSYPRLLKYYKLQKQKNMYVRIRNLYVST